jgi:hypothetical protein
MSVGSSLSLRHLNVRGKASLLRFEIISSRAILVRTYKDYLSINSRGPVFSIGV